MYLSRLVLNPRSRAVRRDLADCHDLHRTVLSAFSESDDGIDARERFGVLHRVDVDRRTGVVTLIVQSKVEPDWSRVPTGYLAEDTEAANPDCKRVDEKYDAVREGMNLRFRLRANPTKKVDTRSGPDGKRRNGRRAELRKQEDLLEWLRRKGALCGFHLTSVRIERAVPNVLTINEGKSIGWRGDPRDGKRRRVTFNSVLFEGELTVEDPELFRRTLESGIGSAKAYGFGLLSIAPSR